MKTANPVSIFVGVDVAKDTLEIYLPYSNQSLSSENAVEPINEFCLQIKKRRKLMVVMEATGGYERLLVNQLSKNGIAAAVTNPRQVRDFAKGLGLDAKTDPIDA